MKKIYFLFTLLLIVLISASPQYSYAQWWKDTVWTKKTDQANGFYMLKFSKNDSLIVGHGYEMDLFFDARKGYEIKRIPGNNEVFFINNDRNFVRLREDNSKFEIFDAKTYTVLDSIENDELHINQYPIIDMSKDEKYLVAGIPNGFRIWDIQTKKIYKTKIYPDESNLKSVGIDNPRFICGTNNVIVQLSKIYYDPNNPNKEIHYGNFVEYDINSIDSIDSFGNHSGYFLSNTCKYIAYVTSDINYGVEVYDFNTKQLLWKIPVNGPSLTGIEFSPDDNYLVTSSSNSDYGMTIWNMATGKELFHYKNGAGYSNIDISYDGKYIAFSIVNGIYMFKAYFDDVSVKKPFNPEKTLYPNPTIDFINVEVQNIESLQGIEIFNIFGTKVSTPSVLRTDTPQEGNLRIDVSALPPGVYFMKMGNEKPQKFMIVN